MLINKHQFKSLINIVTIKKKSCTVENPFIISKQITNTE